MENYIFLVPYLDGDWLGYGPLSPELNYGTPQPKTEEIVENLKNAINFMKGNVDGKFVFGAHTGSYCRDAFFREPIVNLYHEIVNNGGEIAIHPHEEKKGVGNFFSDTEHMRNLIKSKSEELRKAGLKATTFRGAYNGFTADLTQILEENDILIDLSSAPGMENDLWTTHWKGAPLSGHFLCKIDPAHNNCDHPRSNVLEIPMACDDEGNDVFKNYLFNENLTISELKRIWEIVLDRAKNEGNQFVHFLIHLHSMGDNDLTERCRSFLCYAKETGAKIVTPTEAREEFLRQIK